MVVILADLHWADAQVLEFIDELMERLGRLPYVVVGTARHAIHDRWSGPGATTPPSCTSSPRPGRGLVRCWTPLGWEPDDELREQLLDRAGGNPFFLEELVTLLQDTGRVRQPRGPRPAATWPLPDNLRGLIQARLDASAARSGPCSRTPPSWAGGATASRCRSWPRSTTASPTSSLRWPA